MTYLQLVSENSSLLFPVAGTAIVVIFFIVVISSVTVGFIDRRLSKSKNATLPANQSACERSILFTYPTTFAGAEHGESIWRSLNTDLYQYILSELQKSLQREGFKLTSFKDERIHLPRNIHKAIAKQLIVLKEQYLAPLKSQFECEKIAQNSIENGSAEIFLERILAINSELGWYIAHSDGPRDWLYQNLPYRQMKITVRATKEMLTRDVVRCFRDIAYQIKESSFTDKTMDTTETVEVGITCEVQRWSTSSPPGFFPGVAGRTVPHNIEEQHFNMVIPDSCKQYVLLLQGINSTSPEAMAALIDNTAERIAEGESTGADYDDDYGYAFKVFHPGQCS
ncbi:TPA: hypothetical protein ACPZXS_003744 [Citrobacter freundii]